MLHSASPAQKQWFNGYWHNDLDDKQVGGIDDTVLRGSFRAEAGPIEWIFRADYAKLKGDGRPTSISTGAAFRPAQLAILRAILGASRHRL